MALSVVGCARRFNQAFLLLGDSSSGSKASLLGNNGVIFLVLIMHCATDAMRLLL